jgi:hypothetical protein
MAQAGLLGDKVTGILDATDPEATQHDADCGNVTRPREATDQRGQGREGKVTVYGWQLIGLIETRTRIPLAAKGGKLHEHEVLWLRALVVQALANLAGKARPHELVCDKGFWGGAALWWPDPHGIPCVAPAKANMGVTAEAREYAATGEGPAG